MAIYIIMAFLKKQIPFFFLLIISSIPIAISAQDIDLMVPDSLKTKTPTELVNLIESSDAKEIGVYEEILVSFHKNDTSTAKLYMKLGWFFYTKEDFKRSAIYANKVYKIGSKIKEVELLFDADILKGASYLIDGKHQKAFDSYDDALEIAKKAKSIEKGIIANSGRILVLQKMNRLDIALETAEETLQSIEKTSFKNGINHVKILTNLIEIYLDQEQYDLVLYYAEKGIEMSKSLDFKDGLVDLYIKKGIVYYYRKEYDQAFDYLEKAKGILRKYDIDNTSYISVKINYFLASCYYEQQNYDKAITHLCHSMSFIKVEELSKLPVIQSHLLLANCYFKKKDFEQAHYWKNVYVKLNSEYQDDKDKTVDKILKKNTDTLEQEITQLKNKESIATYILILSVTILIILIFIGYRYYRKQKSNKIVFAELLEKINHLELEKNKIRIKNGSTGIVIDDTKVADVLKGLDKLERQEYFLKSECNLTSIAKKVKTNTTYLTKIIHTHKGKKFNEYITDLRIEYVLQRLKNDKRFRAFSVKSIAVDLGYKSDDAFAKHFKAKTGLNPSYYIKNLEKQKEEESNYKQL